LHSCTLRTKRAGFFRAQEEDLLQARSGVVRPASSLDTATLVRPRSLGRSISLSPHIESLTHSSGPPQGDPGDTLDLLQTETLERLSRLLLVLAQLDRDRVGSVVVDGELFDGHGGWVMRR
jgi:hypothetical protein